MKKAHLRISVTTIFLVNFITNAYAYDNVYVFGDSLSDGGNYSRFTTDGANSELYDEYISHQLTGKKLIPSNEKGTNYAQGGSTALPMPRQDPYLNILQPNTKEQLDDYLKQHNGKADPNGIYIHWVGGNDLAEALVADQDDFSKSHEIVNTSANATTEQINQLIKAGAGLIIVPTAPDVGMTPKLLETLIKNSLEKIGSSKERIQEILDKVHKKIDQYDIPSDKARKFALKKIFEELAKKAQEELGIPAEIIEKKLTEAYEKTNKNASELTDIYNKVIDDKISQNNGNLLRADVNALMREVMTNPYIYGIQNTLGYACPQGKLASSCSSKDKEFNKDREFLFSDSFHPTPLGHQVIGQYIASIYIAPSLVMSLTQVNRLAVKGVRASLDGHLQQLRNGGNPQGKIGVFGGYTNSGNHVLTLGSDYQLTDSLLLGAVYSNYQDERTLASRFTYEGRGHVVTTYGLWNLYNNTWLSGDLHYSRINYDSLTRSIQLGKATRREVGSTTGKQWGTRLTAGWDIPVTKVITTSPIIQYTWDKGNIKGYRESGNYSTSMHFSDQKYTSKVGSLGWRVDTQLGRFNPYASVQFNHQFGDTHFKLRSAINSTKTSFVVDSGKQSKDWRQYTVGINADFLKSLHGFAAVTRNEGSAQEPDYNFSLGINASF
ncbi:autotransporter domain-containing protein [Xenorhabdus budapestensis]|uniref:autotransporter domain-containing protein n=1 Tax=Xenorhabdus budapestensis TaxID=290110 RepID=UPI003A8BD1D6